MAYTSLKTAAEQQLAEIRAAGLYKTERQILSPQSLGLNFKTIGLSDSGYIPPDSVGDVGKSQIFMMTNGRIRVRSKQSGTLQFNPTVDTFFDSVRAGSGVSGGVPATVGYREAANLTDGATDTDVYVMRRERRVSVTLLSLDMTARVDLGKLEGNLR